MNIQLEKKMQVIKIMGIALLLALAGCGMQPESQVKAGDGTVSRLFEVDGCRVYRFVDVGTYRYFTNCSGSTEWKESCGKNCTRRTGVAGGGQ